MDRRHAIWVLLLFILQGEPAEGQLVDVCSSCHPNATCDLKQDGSGLTCHCMYGFVGNGRTLCQDKDECQIGAKKICGPHAFCHNTLGSYQCTCVSGYSPSNTHTIFIPNDGTYCRDVDECLRTPGLCGVGARCVNLEGDFECVCLPGYTAPTEPFHPLRDRGSCRDVDECLRTPGLCGVGARCVNLDGDFECVCLPGYTAPTEPFHPLRDRGSCRAVDCGPPTPREGATLLSSTGTAYGSVALWGCRDGFLWRRGENVSRCAERGDWSGPDLVCEETRCGPPPVLRHTEQVWSGDTAPGSSALYSCTEGFYNKGTGNGLVHCHHTGHWTKTTIRCQAVSCGNPPVLPHTGRLWNGSSSPGTIVFYYCKMGFHEDKIDFNNRHDAANMSVCNIHGHWTGPNILCKAIDCGMPPDAPHAIALWGKVSALGSTVVYQCEPGYRNAGRGNRSVCSASGVWRPTGLHCQEIQCGEPLLKPHAEFLWDGSSRMGSVVYYRCVSGYRAAPATHTSVCTENGRWQESDLRCQELRCGVPLTLPRTNLLWDGRSAPGSVALYLCAEGYFQQTGQHRAVSKCSQTGEWGHVSLKCRATCGPVPRLARAEVVWSNASMALHRCVDGYHSWRGSYVSVCGSTGDWQQATLRCTEVKPAIYDLQVFNESCVRWRADKFEADKEVYKVVYRGTRHYQATFHHERKQFLPSLDESVDVCLSLLPATNYTVSVSALSARFTATITTNTSLQAPQAPLIFYRELDSPSSLTLTLQRSAHTLDAISVYQVFVVPLDGTVVFDCKSRASPEFSPAGRSPTQYVAGQFPLRHMGSTQMNFTVGDGRHHGGFFNAPLRRGMNYYVILRVASHWQEGFQSSCVLWVKVKGTSHVMRMASLCAAGLIGALLLVVLLGYCYNWFFNRSDAL